MIRVLDLFCGTGALSFGLKSACPDFQTVAGIDLDDAACRTAEANAGQAVIVNEPIEDVDPHLLLKMSGAEAIDVIVGGPPCQGFSSLRPSRGTTLDDPRNHLYTEYARFVESLRPKAFLLENVVGIVHATGGALLADLVERFRSLGYSTEWKIVNAAHYGVPQKRERFILLGVRDLPEGTASLLFPTPTHRFSGRTIGIRDKRRHQLGDVPAGIPALSAWAAISDLPSLPSGGESDKYRTAPKNDYQAKMRAAGSPLTFHKATRHNDKMLEVIAHSGPSKASLPEGLVTSGYSSCYSRIDPAEPAPTVTVKFTSPASSKCIHPYDDRAITPREAARLQSFPDDFQFVGSKTDVANQIGNAVPPMLAEAFAAPLARILRLADQSRASNPLQMGA